MKNNKELKKGLKKVSMTMVATTLISPSLPIGVSTKIAVGAIAAMGIGLVTKSAIADNDSTLNKSIVSFRFNKDSGKKPALFHLPNTNKVVIDLFGVDRTFQEIPQIENDPLIDRISSKLVNDRVRFVIETKKPVKFNYVVDGNMAKVELVESSIYAAADSTGFITPAIEKNKTSGLSNTWVDIKSSGISAEDRAEMLKKAGFGDNVSIKEAKQEVESKKEDVASVDKKVLAKNEETKNVEVVTQENVFTEITKINLKKEGAKNARLTIGVSDRSVSPIIKKDGNKLILDFKNVSIPNELQKRINTENVGSINQILDVSMQKSNGRIILEQKDGWDYSFSQVDKQIIIDLRVVDKKDDDRKYVGKPMTIGFQDMDVRAILQVFADFTGLNIMSSDQVSGTMTIRLKDIPWDQALDLVLESRGLQKIKDGNVIWVATSEEVAAKNKAKLELQNQNAELDPLKLEFFQINYYKAEVLKAILEGRDDKGEVDKSKVSFISKRGSIGVDLRNNMLYVQETEAKLREIRKIINKFDIPTKQVLVEAKIVIADDTFGKELGTRFGVRARGTSGNRAIGVGGNILESANVANDPSSVVTPLTNLAASAINTVAPGAIGITLLNLANGNALGIELSALEQNNRGKVLSNPRLLTADNKKAVIEQGTEIPYVTPGTANSPPTVAFKKAVLKLEVTPQISPNGKVVMNLQIRKDTIGQLINVQGGGQVPSIDTKNIDTLVTVNSGQTVVLGGVYEFTTRNEINKIPLFGDIPVLGYLFKKTSTGEEKGELLIFITPYIVDEQDLDMDSGGNTLPSQEINLTKK